MDHSLSRRRLLLLALLGGTALATGCSRDEPEPPPRFDPASASYEHGFTDGSTPPEYHRSFTVTAGPPEGEGVPVRIVVRSYEDELHDESATIGLDVWRTFIADAPPVLAEADRSPKEDPPAPGSSSTTVTLADASVRWEVTAAPGTGDALRKLIVPLVADFDMEELLRPSR